MTNGGPRNDLEPAFRGDVDVYLRRINRTGDTQRNAKWKWDHYGIPAIPLGYEVTLELTITYTGENDPPRRRKEDRDDWKPSDTPPWSEAGMRAHE